MPNLTAEESKQAEEVSSTFLEALRRTGVELPSLNASQVKNLNETKIKQAQDLIEKSDQLKSLN